MKFTEAEQFRIQCIVESLFVEGVFDPAIFKAFFMAGGPGSGKSFVSRAVTGGHGLVTVNSDTAFEILLKKAGMSLKLDTLDPAEYGAVRAHAGDLTKVRQHHWVNERLGMVIDGTGREASKIEHQKHALEQLGYDTYMIFVNTSLEVALSRNAQRDRTVPEHVVREAWQHVQDNIPAFRSMFGGHFYVVENNGPNQDLLDLASKWVRSLVNTPPQNPIAKKWIADRGGTGAIAKWS